MRATSGPGRMLRDGASRAWLTLRRGLRIRHVRLHLGDVRLRLRADSVSEYVAARTVYGERDAVQALARSLPPGGVFYDIGANIGVFSLACAPRASHVVAFEPAPANLEALRHNVAVNAADNVRILPIALGEKEGEVSFFVGDPRAGSQVNSLSQAVVDRFSGHRPREVKVPCVRLDSIVASEQLPPPDIVKVDVEGAEGPVLRGAEAVLRARRPILHLELHPGAMETFGDTAPELLRWVEGLGYDVRSHPVRDCIKVTGTPRTS